MKKAPVKLNEEELKKAQDFFNLEDNLKKSEKLIPVKYSRNDSKLPYSVWKIYNPETKEFDFYEPFAGRVGTTRMFGLLGKGGLGKAKKIKKVYDGKTNELVFPKNPNVIKIQKIENKVQYDIAQNEIKYLQILKKHIMSGEIKNKKGQIKIVSIMPMFVGKSLFDIMNDSTIDQIKKLNIIIAVLRKLKSEIHDAGLVHGDFHLDNVIVNIETMEVSIIDLGFTGEIGKKPPSELTNCSKWAHNSQKRGDALDPKMDIYNFCKYIVLYCQDFKFNKIIIK